MSSIHSTALVDPGAQLHESVAVGPYAVIGPRVRVGEGTRIGAHCVIDGRTTLGRNNQIFQFASIGAAPQDKKYAGEDTALEIGDGNTIREFTTLNTGSAQGGGVTRVGNDNWIMAYVHIAHDCQVGNHTTFSNAATLAGHVEIGDWAVIGGLTGIHQFVRIGAHVMTGFQSRISQDVPPFVTVNGNPPQVSGLNSEGLRRRGFSPERMAAIKHMHRILYRQNLTLAQAQAEVERLYDRAEGDERVDAALMRDFLAQAGRGIVR